MGEPVPTNLWQTIQFIGAFLTGLVGAATIAVIIVNGWVKAKDIQCLREELDQVRHKQNEFSVLSTKIDNITQALLEMREDVKDIKNKG